jgi:spermidine synthase
LRTVRYDLISVDAYTRGKYGSTIPAHMVTQEFFREASARLSQNGILHYHSSANRDNLFTRSLYRTLRSVFPSVIVLGDTEFLASNTTLHPDIDLLIARADDLRTHLPRIDDRIRSLQLPVPDTSNVPILTDDYAPVDTLLRHGG